MDRHADDAFDRSHRSEVDDRDHLVCDVGEAEARRAEHARRPAQLVGAVAGKEALDRCAPAAACAGRRAPPPRPSRRITRCGSRRQNACVAGPAARCASASDSAASADGGERRDQNQTDRFRRHRAVGRQSLTHREGGLLERLGGKALYRIPVDGVDFEVSATMAGLVSRSAATCCRFPPGPGAGLAAARSKTRIADRKSCGAHIAIFGSGGVRHSGWAD